MVIGLTGGIGSGKSMVARLFELMGCKLIDSDEVAKQLYFKPSIKSQIVELLGPDAYLSEKLINKKFISEKIFNDSTLLKRLNHIIHPEVKNELNLFFKTHKNEIIIKESALLFEAGLEKEVDKIIVVTADDETRINRVMLRDGSQREHVIKQINAQIKQEEKIKSANYIIRNNEDNSLIEQVLSVLKLIKTEQINL